MGILETEIIVGTYESFLIGCRIEKKVNYDDEYELTQTFCKIAHNGPVRTVLGMNKFVISGGSDELVKIFDLVNRKEQGQLEHHDGTITCLAGYDRTHLLTGSDDNSLSVTVVGQWQIEKTLYKHQAGITALAMHPSGKLAFTTGKDKKLITWNLVQARPAFITNIKGIAEFVVVSPDGLHYCVGLHRRVDVYSLENAGIKYTIELKSRPNGLVFLGNEAIAVACESAKVQIHSLTEKSLIKEFEAHEIRVRCIATIPEETKKAAETTKKETAKDASTPEKATEVTTEETDSVADKGYVIITASSSDHFIKLWRIHLDSESEVKCIGSLDTTCRVTCLTTWNPSMIGRKKKKSKKRQNPDIERILPVQEKKKSKVSFGEEPKKIATAEKRIPAPQLISIEVEENDRNEIKKPKPSKAARKQLYEEKQAAGAKKVEIAAELNEISKQSSEKFLEDTKGIEGSAPKSAAKKKKKNMFSESVIES